VRVSCGPGVQEAAGEEEVPEIDGEQVAAAETEVERPDAQEGESQVEKQLPLTPDVTDQGAEADKQIADEYRKEA
jgi:hypothetical protein